MKSSKLIYAILLGILFIFWILYRGSLSYQLLLTGLLVPAILLLILFIQRFFIRIQIRRSVSEVSRGEPFQWTLQLRNLTPLPIANAVIVLEYIGSIEQIPRRVHLRIPLMPLNTQRVMLTFHGTTCGIVELKLVSMRIYDPLRLFSLKIRKQLSNSLLVMPDCFEEDADSLSLSEEADDDATEFSKTKSGDDPSEIFEIHDYHEGDAISRIHWKLSSKLDELMVKAYSLPIHANTLLLPDYRRAGEGAEAAARMDAMLCAFYAVSNRLRNENLPQSILWYQPSQKMYMPCALTAPEDTEQILRQIIQSSPPADGMDAALDALEQNLSCSRLIFFTPKLDAQTVALLPHLAEHRNLTVFYVLGENEAETLPDGAEAFDCVPVAIRPAEMKEASVALEEGDELLCEEEL